MKKFLRDFKAKFSFALFIDSLDLIKYELQMALKM